MFNNPDAADPLIFLGCLSDVTKVWVFEWIISVNNNGYVKGT